MHLSDEPALSTLNALLIVCNDGQRGYEAAADDATDPELRKLFSDYAVQRMKFEEKIVARIRALRGEPAMRSTLAGDLHRVWMDVKAAAASAQNHAVLVEVERAEDLAVMAYREALKIKD